jgi:hypothetical protein
VWLNTDLLYYRWRVATAAKNSVVASGFLHHALGQRHRPHSAEAACQYRLAREAGHSSAERRGQELAAYDAEEGNERINERRSTSRRGLAGGPRQKMASGNPQQDIVYKYRAEWEIRGPQQNAT